MPPHMPLANTYAQMGPITRKRFSFDSSHFRILALDMHFAQPFAQSRLALFHVEQF
jgi:hypothetical protein